MCGEDDFSCGHKKEKGTNGDGNDDDNYVRYKKLIELVLYIFM